MNYLDWENQKYESGESGGESGESFIPAPVVAFIRCILKNVNDKYPSLELDFGTVMANLLIDCVARYRAEMDQFGKAVTGGRGAFLLTTEGEMRRGQDLYDVLKAHYAAEIQRHTDNESKREIVPLN